ncbi:outer membrane protein [Hyphomicrobium sulfonivorans]|uniref:outer membrane protein n=1 Tax=Hyphomicrobium sulfonivorans TaxID=121290 RepID=UPI00156DB4D3|nr:outer membrane beta-barrel protein [Hyphomicrobium sulfonivorans]MBI1648596.1 porin family protein [Hyphomicrobium sulfonivorans]NSL70865.1 hypothetical protein [Hyphomicrobium sulfonivorans]
MAAAQTRRFWQRSCLAAWVSAVVSATSPAQADPTHADPWNGFYVGAFAGGAWGSGHTTTDVGEVNATSYFSTQQNVDLVEGDTSGKARSGSFTGGVQLGAQQRFNQVVVGAEADFGALDLSGSRGAADIPYPTFPTLAYTARASYSTNWLSTARVRIGWLAAPNMLLFVSGGLALSDVNVSNTFYDKLLSGSISARGSSSNTRIKAGYTLGGGVEASLGGPWSIKAEYLYVDLGEVSTSGVVLPPLGIGRSPLDTSIDLTANIARLGVNYSFSD